MFFKKNEGEKNIGKKIHSKPRQGGGLAVRPKVDKQRRQQFSRAEMHNLCAALKQNLTRPDEFVTRQLLNPRCVNNSNLVCNNVKSAQNNTLPIPTPVWKAGARTLPHHVVDLGLAL